jgi:hypothetical protein
MPRQYKITFEGVAVSAAQDLLQINGATGKMARIVRCWVGATNTSLPTAQMLETRCRLLPATVTNGTGGTSVTPQKTDLGDAAASITALANNTSKATTSGTAVIIDERGDHIYSGVQCDFPERPAVGPSEAFVFELLSTVSGSVSLSGGALVEEIGG